MTILENTMVFLYEEAYANGKPLNQIRAIAKANRMSEDDVVEILKKNGCDVEVYEKMAKRGRPPKCNKAPEIKEPETKEKEIMASEETIIVSNASSEIPEIVIDICRQKVKFNADVIKGYEEKIDKLMKEQKELEEFIDRYVDSKSEDKTEE